MSDTNDAFPSQFADFFSLKFAIEQLENEIERDRRLNDGKSAAPEKYIALEEKREALELANQRFNTEPKSHKDFLAITTDIGLLRDDLAPEDALLIEKYGTWYRALVTKRVAATTAEQKRFIEVHEGKLEPITKHEKAWMGFRAVSINKLKSKAHTEWTPQNSDLSGRFISMKDQLDSLSD